MLGRFNKKLESYPVITFVYVIWLIEQVYFFQKIKGVRIVYDSHRYLAGALHWSNFDPFYSYSAIISPFAHLDFLIGITLFQIVLNLIALYCFIKIIQNFSDNKLTLLVGGLMFLWPELQYWNFFIHTESIFVSLSVFIIYFHVFNKSKWAILIMLILCFIRPNGFIFLLSYLFYSFYKKVEIRKLIIPSIVVLATLFWVLTDLVIPTLGNYPFESHLRSGSIITGVNTWSVKSNGGLDYCKDCVNSLKVISLVLKNPWFFFKFYIGRIIVLFTQVRPYYGAIHNIGVVSLFLPIYFFAGRYLWKEKFIKYSFILLPIIFEVIVVLISGVDWDNRYIVIILPCIFLLSTYGFDKWLKISKSDK